MIYKTKQIKRDIECSDGLTHEQWLLRKVLALIDWISELLGFGEITITDFLRDGDEWLHSLHHRKYARAADVRVRDKSVAWYVAMMLFGQCLHLLNNNIRFNMHYDTYRKDNQHIHVEIRIRG